MTTAIETGYDKRPDYRVDLLRRRNRVRVELDGQVLADTTAAILVDEQDHGLVFYVPAGDVDTAQLVATDDRTRCPYKGWARYWRHVDREQPIAWGYPEPYPQVAQLLDHIAFYQDRVNLTVGQ